MRWSGKRALRTYLAIGTVTIAGHAMASGGPLADRLYVLVALIALVGSVVGLVLHRPQDPVPWRWVVLGLGSAFAGTAVARLADLAGGSAAVPRTLHGIGYACAVGLVWALGRRRSGYDTVDRILASAIMATSASIVAWVFVVQALWSLGPEGGIGGSIRALFPLLSLSVAAVLLRLLSTDGLRSGAQAFVAAALVTYFLADLGDAVALLAAATATPVPETIRLSAYVLMGAATLHPSLRRSESPDGTSGAYRLNRTELVAVLIAGIAAPASLVLRLGVSTPTELVVIGVGSALLVGLVVARMWRLMYAVADSARQENEQRFRALVENAGDVICIVAPSGELRYVSPTIERVWGYPPGEFQERAAQILDDETWQELTRTVLDLLASPETDTARVQGRARHADLRWRRFEAMLVDRTDDPAIGGILITANDVTARVDLEERLWNEAFIDDLTGLPNRALLLEQATQALRDASEAASPALVVLDIDDFKTINDSLGPQRGDELLRTVARRLGAIGDGTCMAARLAADAFAVLVPSNADADTLAASIIAAVGRPVMVAGRRIEPRVSVGIARGERGSQAADLLQNADAAMHVAKRHTRGGLRVFDPEMHAAAVRRLQLQMDLASAAGRGQLWLAYQPIHEIRSGRMAGVEALLRWDHPTRGPISPAEFIPLAETSGAIGALGEYVLRRACQDMAERRVVSGEDLTLSVNLSPSQLGDPGLPDMVAAALAESGFPAPRLTLEVTEGVFLDDSDGVIRALGRLRALGVRLAIDDFGTGYCSLGYLTRFRFDIVKIDRSFIDVLDTPGADRRVTLGILELVSSLEVPAVAEGIETHAQLDDLRAIGCEFGQGYHWSRPVRIDELALPSAAALEGAARDDVLTTSTDRPGG